MIVDFRFNIPGLSGLGLFDFESFAQELACCDFKERLVQFARRIWAEFWFVGIDHKNLWHCFHGSFFKRGMGECLVMISA